MAIRNWRWWHWLFVSLVVGGLLGLVFTLQEVDDPTVPSTAFWQMNDKLQRHTDNGDSLVTRIRVSPIITDSRGRQVQSVTYWERQRSKATGHWDPVRQFRTVTPVPMSPASPRKDFGVLDYLADMKKGIPTLDWRYQWWLAPKMIWAFSLGGSVLLIGILWPMTLKALVKLGLAEPPDERMDLSQVRRVDTSSDSSSAPKVTADDQQRLAELNAAMEADVAGMEVTDAPAAPIQRPAAPGVRALGTGTGVDESTSAANPDGPHEYTGEFYPVDRVKPKQPPKVP